MRRAGSLAYLCAVLIIACGNGSRDASEPVSEPVAHAGTAVLEVQMLGFHSDDGSALVGLYTASDGFPDDGAKARERIEVPIASGRATAIFENIPAARVAVAVLHDEDGDKKMKTGFVGQPKEGYGVSRDAPARFGPPKFDDAALEVKEGERRAITIKINY